MLRSAAVAAVAFFAAVSVLLGAGPSVAAVVPPPVADVTEVPSQLVRAINSIRIGEGVGGSPALRASSVMKAKLAHQKRLAATPKPPTAPKAAPLPKVITGPAAPVRGLGPNPAGIAVAGFMGGWALGQGGLTLYSAATDQSYEELICATPDWYQAANSFLMFGVTPDCAALIPEPNPDVVAGYGPACTSDGLWCAHLLHTSTFEGAGYLSCYSASSASPPSGWNAYYQNAAGLQRSMSWVPSGAALCGADLFHNGIASGNNAIAPGYFWLVGPAAQVIHPETLPANPERETSCRISWEDGTETTATGATYTEDTGLPFSASGLGCEQAFVSKPGAGPALMPDRITVETQDGTGEQIVIMDSEVPDYTPDQRKSLNWDPSKGGLQLHKVVNGVTDSCMTWAADCAQWWPDTSQGTQPVVGVDEYRCTFGGEAIDLAECGVYRTTFDTQTDTPTITDPETGEQVEWETTTNPANSTNPGTGPTPGEACMEGWASAPNPIEWVLHPVKCALVWAFVPRTDVVTTQTASLGTKWDSKGPAALGRALGGMAFVPPGNGCEGLAVPLGDVYGHGVQNFRVLEACPGDPLQPLAALSTVVIGIASVLGVIWSVTRSFGGIVGFTGLGGGRGGE